MARGGEALLRPSVARAIAEIALWAVVVAASVFLTVQRFRQAIATDAGDDLRIFVRAAAEVRAGHSPYDAAEYVYSPLVAWVMTPFSSLASAIRPWAAISLFACGATVAVVTITFRRVLTGWRRPVLALIGIVSLLFSQVTVTELWLGQVDTLVLLLTATTVLLATLRLPAGSGITLALSALVKSWPLGTALWLFRRGAEGRWKGASALVAGFLVVTAVVLVTGGPHEITQWISRTGSSSSQPLLAYSVWGFGRFLFAANGVMPPLINAPILASVLSSVLALCVIGLIIVALRRPGSASLAMWNITAAIVLLLPVSHLAYRILMIPLLWVWAAYALRSPRVGTILTTTVMALFWAVTNRTDPLDAAHSANHVEFAAIIVVALVALTVSVIAAARSEHSWGDRDERGLA